MVPQTEFLFTEASLTPNSLFPVSQSSFQTTVFDQLTLQWVVETGRPMLEATTTVTAEASSMLKPLQGNKNNTHVSLLDVSEHAC